MGGRGASSGINRVGIRKLEKSNKSLGKQIHLHKDKIGNPEKYAKDWATRNKKQRHGLIKHWQIEIEAFQKTIRENRKKIKGLKDK